MAGKVGARGRDPWLRGAGTALGGVETEVVDEPVTSMSPSLSGMRPSMTWGRDKRDGGREGGMYSSRQKFVPVP